MKIKRFEFNMFPVNCYVLWDDTKEAVVIDPGCFYEEEKQALKKFILTNELNVKHLLNTHLHLDHIFGNPFMLKEFGLSAEANKADEFWIDEAPKQSRMFGFQLQEEPVPLGKYLHDGDIITFGHTKLEAIHVPGHSPGSLVYYCKEENCMFSGDVLFQGSIGRADLSELSCISPGRPPMQINDQMFPELFAWLSRSARMVSMSMPGDGV